MRIAIIGNSGSGKTTLARQLAGQHAVPVLDLDAIAWEPGQVAVARNREIARQDLHEFCRSNPSWIVEGCYGDLIGATLEYGPELILLNPGLERCLANCRARSWEPAKYASKTAQDARLDFLLAWVAEYYARDGDLSLAGHQALYRGYDGPKRMLSELPALNAKAGELVRPHP